MSKWIIGLFLSYLSLCTGLALAEESLIAPEQYQAALQFHQQYGEKGDLERFDKKTPAAQAVLLGSTLALRGGDRALGARFLLDALKHPEQLNQFDIGYTNNLLGGMYQNDGELDKAATFFQHARSADYTDACSNLGVVREEQNNYILARLTYLDCLKRSPTALAYLNLGTLYFNGLGVAKDPQKGGHYWSKSFEKFAYDPDTNYNLGIYHLRHTRHFENARYHLSLALALGDADVLPKLAERSVIGIYSDSIFAAQLRLAPDTNRRRWIIQDRLRYTLEERYLDHTDEQGMTFTLSENAKEIQLTAQGQSDDQIEQAVIRMLWLIYVDRLSPISLDLQRMVDELINNKKTSLVRHGWRHLARISAEGELLYSASMD